MLRGMKADLHTHTIYSGYSTLPYLSRLLLESYNTPEQVYHLAKARGMDLVAITDHDAIGGALALGDRDDVIVGCEVTGEFPDEPVSVHLNVFDITETQHAEIQRRRHNVRDLMPYLRAQNIFVSLNHVASGINGPVTGAHIAALLPWVDALEIRNGSRLPCQNRTAVCLANAHGKTGLAGSDAHTTYALGRTWVDAPGATNRAEFMRELRAGRVEVGGRHGGYFRLANDIARAVVSVYRERGGQLLEHPLDWRRHAIWWGGLASMPVAAIPFLLAAGHFLLEGRFNRQLLFDLVATPPTRLRPRLQEAA